ncbi:MAG TPA: TetR/AcrR family transcriptional regulator [Anaerolineales bacterium]|nr:TetR/AcrR family transcriptional regulator [Anaerolineales bacterium]HNA89229.1 TetR/AcrR family transcriptional regulator [Anaerolineales bacterium]HNB36691.1 TetR/AcrR family transcriptional regulator [Anaerolineales bacterium]HNC09039.1 TetR/AcrR family transcriptional regulator [Anaerolineales bacterium]
MPEEIITKGERTRQQIEDAAIELFMEQGYHATSMRQIAERAELALGGIYNHFKSKDEIFEAIIVDKHPYKRILPLVQEAEGETMEDFLSHAARVVITELTSQPYYIKLMMIEIVEFNGVHGASLIKEIAPKLLPVFERIIRTKKNLRITHPAVLLRSFIGMVLSYLLTDIMISNSMLSKLMPKNPMDAYVDIYMHGIIKETTV